MNPHDRALSLSRYLHTLRYLRGVQVYGRVRNYLRRVQPDLSPAPQARTRTPGWQGCFRRPSLLEPNKFRFLNVNGTVAKSEDWNDPAQTRLWLFNLHYFDDLVAADAVDRAYWHNALITRWIEENPPGHGVGWEPYPTSLRIVNWVKWAMAQADEPNAHVLDSLAVQSRWLRSHIEVHLLGNHLLANAKALIFAGVFFTGREAESWLRSGCAIFGSELDEQILDDGGHFERSPMYHAIVLEDTLDVINVLSRIPGLAADTLVARAKAGASRMLHWLRVMTHPDGEVSFFNDAAFGIAPTLASLNEYAQHLAVTVPGGPLQAVEWLRESGYVRLQNARAVVLCDVAPVGPDYQPGHAHADTLSFELSLDGNRVVVNTGTSTYEIGPQRALERSTMAHNTVEVDGADSSEVWAGFRVARRARPFAVSVGEDRESLRLEASHDGYRRLKGRVVHHRKWELRESSLSVEDELTGRFGSARALLHIHPTAEVIMPEALAGPFELRTAQGESIRVFTDPAVAPSIADWIWSPEFGQVQACSSLQIPIISGKLVTRLAW